MVGALCQCGWLGHYQCSNPVTEEDLLCDGCRRAHADPKGCCMATGGGGHPYRGHYWTSDIKLDWHVSRDT